MPLPAQFIFSDGMVLLPIVPNPPAIDFDPQPRSELAEAGVIGEMEKAAPEAGAVGARRSDTKHPTRRKMRGRLCCRLTLKSWEEDASG